MHLKKKTRWLELEKTLKTYINGGHHEENPGTVDIEATAENVTEYVLVVDEDQTTEMSNTTGIFQYIFIPA